MIVRRVLFGACAVLFVTATPAAADHTYNHILGDTVRPPGVSTAGQGGATAVLPSGSGSSSTSGGGSLARTGSDYLVPMAEAATVLIGAGALLVLATRRRRSTSTSTSTA